MSTKKVVNKSCPNCQSKINSRFDLFRCIRCYKAVCGLCSVGELCLDCHPLECDEDTVYENPFDEVCPDAF